MSSSFSSAAAAVPASSHNTASPAAKARDRAMNLGLQSTGELLWLELPGDAPERIRTRKCTIAYGHHLSRLERVQGMDRRPTAASPGPRSTWAAGRETTGKDAASARGSRSRRRDRRAAARPRRADARPAEPRAANL